MAAVPPSADTVGMDSTNAFGYRVGQWVATRRGKKGEVVAVTEDTVTVRFGSREFEMRNGQVVHADAYDAMTRRRPNPNQYFLRGR